MDTSGISDEAVHAAAEAVYGCGFDGSPVKDAWLADFRKALEAAAQLEPELKTQWGVRYDTHVDVIEPLTSNEAWVKVIFDEKKSEGAIVIVSRQVSEWEVAYRG